MFHPRKILLAGLCLAAAATLTLGRPAGAVRFERQALKLELPPLPIQFENLLPQRARESRDFKAPEWRVDLRTGGLFGRGFKLCGMGVVYPSDWILGSIPVGEVETLAPLIAAYRPCRAIRAWVLDPVAKPADFPDGKGGEAVYPDWLVSKRVEVADGSRLNQIFLLLAESINEGQEMPDWEIYEWMLEGDYANFRKSGQFVARLAVEFVGEVPLRMEFDETNGWTLIRAGDRWGVFGLDRQSFRALQGIFADASADESR